MEVKEAIEFLEELRNNFIDVDKMMKEISSRELWNKNINGIREVIYILKLRIEERFYEKK